MSKLVMLLVRHGDTVYDDEKLAQGWPPGGMNLNGAKDIEETIAFMQEERYPVTHVYCSDQERATDAAKMIARAYGVPFTSDYRLRTWALGILTGKSRDENVPWFHFFIDNPGAVIPQGESKDDFEARFGPAFEELLEDAEANGLSVVVTHAANIIAANSMLDDTPDEPELVERVKPAGVVEVRTDGDGYRMDAWPPGARIDFRFL